MEKINWLTMMGFVDITDEKIIFKPEQIKYDSQNGYPFFQKESYGRSNLDMESGEITFNLELGEPTNRFQIVFDAGNNDFLYVGINTGAYAFGIMRGINGYYQMLSSIGNYQSINMLNNIQCKILKDNFRFIFFVNGVKVSEAIYPLKKGTIGLYFCGNKDISISDFSFTQKKRIAFVAMEFTDEYNELFKEVITLICEKYGYECIRADEIYRPTPILNDIIESIYNASVIIAEITSKNPNVFYEIGYSHAIQKPTILLCDKNKVDKLPFDISGFRTLFYENTISGKTKIEENLSKYLEKI
jgi:hypothetical protein